MIKRYKCQRCNTTFVKGMTEKFIKTIMPKCPACGSTEVKAIAFEKAK